MPRRASGIKRNDDERVEDHGRHHCRGRRVQAHDVERAEDGVSRGERRRNDGKVLGQVVGDAERSQRSAGHQHLLADLDDL